MQNTTIGNTTGSLPSLDEAGVPVSTLCALFDRAVVTAPDYGTVMLPYPIWREAFINDADQAKSSYDSLSPEPYQPHCDKLDLERFYATQIPKSYLNGTEDNALPHPRMSRGLGLFRLIQMPGSHEVIFAKTPPKIDHRLLGPFLPGLDDRIPHASAQFSTEGRTQWRIFQPSV
jgi:hypothetical protein